MRLAVAPGLSLASLMHLNLIGQHLDVQIEVTVSLAEATAALKVFNAVFARSSALHGRGHGVVLLLALLLGLSVGQSLWTGRRSSRTWRMECSYC